jgi:hypothetical protein
MTKVKKFLFAALLVLPILMFSSAMANNGHDRHEGMGGRERRVPNDFDRDDAKQGSSVPIDGGLSILLAAGIGLGVFAAHRKFKRQTATI